MTRTRYLLPLLLLAAVFALSCVAKPKMNYSTEQLARLYDVDELMRSLYHDLSPVWEADKKEKLAAADFPVVQAAAPRVEAISAALSSKQVTGRFKDGFSAHATRLGEQAQAMGKAAAARDRAAVRKALAGINGTCSSCHQNHK